LLVILFHSGLFNFGWVGVQLFFVLSGFLITQILYEYKAKLKFGKYLKVFYLRRILRIFPLYYLYLLILGVCYLLFNFPSEYKEQLLGLVTYTFNLFLFENKQESTALIYHLWSLCVEEQFYLFWPLIVFIINKRTMAYLVVLLFFVIPIFRYFYGHHLADLGLSDYEVGDSVYWFTISHIDAFGIGGMVAIYRSKLKKFAFQLFLIMLFITFSAGLLNALSQTYSISQFLTTLGYKFVGIVNYQHVWSYTILNLFSASFILLLIEKDTWLNRVFEKKWLIEIGKVSYGTYVYHVAVLTIFSHLFSGYIKGFYIRLLVFVLYVIVIFFISKLSFQLFEVKFLKLKKHFTAQ